MKHQNAFRRVARCALGTSVLAAIAAPLLVAGPALAADPASAVGAAPTGVTATDITGSSATIAWNAVPGADEYEVRVPGSSRPVAVVDNTSYPFEWAAPDKDYTVQVRAVDGSAKSTWSSVRLHTAPMLAVGAGESVVPVAAGQDAASERAALGMKGATSDLQPTGRFIRSGQPLTVTVPDGVDGLELAVGLEGKYFDINDCHEVGMHTVALRPGTNTIDFLPHDGLVYLKNTGTADAAAVVRGGVAAPTFIVGTTSQDAFERQLAATESPMAVVVGENAYTDVYLGGYVEETAGEVAKRGAAYLHDMDVQAAAVNLDRIVATYDERLSAERANRIHVVAAGFFPTPGSSNVLTADHIGTTPGSMHAFLSEKTVDAYLLDQAYPAKQGSGQAVGVGKVQLLNSEREVAATFELQKWAASSGVKVLPDAVHGGTKLDRWDNTFSFNFAVYKADGTRTYRSVDVHGNRSVVTGLGPDTSAAVPEGGYVVITTDEAGRTSFVDDGEQVRGQAAKQAFQRVGLDLVPVGPGAVPGL